MSEASPHTFAWARIRCSSTNSAPSRSRYSASVAASDLLSSHGMDQHSHRAQAVRVSTTSCVRSATLCSTLWFAMRAPAALRCDINHRPSQMHHHFAPAPDAQKLSCFSRAESGNLSARGIQRRRSHRIPPHISGMCSTSCLIVLVQFAMTKPWPTPVANV